METTLLDRLLLVNELFQRDLERAYAGTSLSASRMHVLWVLQHEGPVTQQTLAERLGITPRGISGVVDALEEAAYVRRAAHPTDRRAHLVELAPQGSSLMERTVREHAELGATLLEAVAPADRAALQRGLDAVSARFAELLAAASGDAP